MFQFTNTKTLLGVLFAVSIVVANITASKIAFFALPVVGSIVLPAGFLAIAVAFLASDLLSELHGREAAHEVVTATVIALGAAFVLIEVAISFTPAPFYKAQTAYSTVLGGSTTIVVAAIVTTLVSQHLDVSIFHVIRERVRFKFARNLGSTAASQLVDTTLFITLAFVVLPMFMGGTVTPPSAAVALILGQYALKLIVAVLDTPLFYVFTAVSERR